MAKAKILVVEDELEVGTYIQKCLERSGFKVSAVVATAEEAVAAAKIEIPDLALMDIGLPGEMDGVDAAAKLRFDQGIPVIFLTSSADEQTLERAKCTEPIGYLLKPFDPQVLQTTIESSLYQYRASIERAHEALAASERMYKTLFEKSAEGILVADIESRQFKHANPAICKMLGYTGEELTRLGVVDIHPKEALDHVTAAFEAQARGKKTRAPEIPCLRKDGNVIFADITSAPVWIEGREYNVGFFTDVSERKRAELQRLRSLECQARLNQLQQALLAPGEMEQKLKMITNSVVDIFAADFCRIWIIGRGDLCELGCVHATATEGLHACLYRDKCLRLIASSGRYTHTDGTVHRRVPFGVYKIGRVASGHEHKFLTNDVAHDPRVHNRDWAQGLGLVSFAGYQLRPPGGETVGVLALFSTHAITTEEDAQLDSLSNTAAQVIRASQYDAALQESEKKYRALIETTGTGYVIVDSEGKVLDANKEYVRLTGHGDLKDILHHRVTEWTARHDLARNAEEVRKCTERGYVRNLMIDYVNEQGEHTPVEVSATVLSMPEGIKILTVCRDVTERKRAEEQRQRMEIMLRQAQKMESIGQLAAGIAHEINTPTQYVGDNTRFFKDAFADVQGVLKIYGQLLDACKQGSVPAELLRNVESQVQSADLDYISSEIPKAIAQTLEGVDRIATIVRAMKDFSHPGTKEKIPTNIHKAIESTLIVCRNEYKYVAEATTDFDESMPPVPCFPGDFNQVIMNLIINAAHAIAGTLDAQTNSKGKIAITTRHDDSCAEIRISDTGTGIPENIRSRIFDPFFTTKEVGKGTGQGLAICHAVVVIKHGGTITFESQVGRGTTFIIRLPLDGSGKQSEAA